MNQRFEWDERKSDGNLRKHGVAFEVAIEVFDDPHHIVVPDESAVGEARYITVGRVEEITLVVVHTVRHDEDEVIRVISARRGTRQERRRYEEHS